VKAAPASKRGILLPKPPEPFKPTGVDLAMPHVEGDAPLFRVTTPDGDPAEGAFGQWSPFTPDEADPSTADAGTTAGHPPSVTPTKTPFTVDPNLHQTVSLLPGTYEIHFSLPVPADPLQELNGTFTWSQSLRVSKEKLTPVNVTMPALPQGGIAHVRIKKAGPMTPFNQLTLEPVDTKGGGPVSRWDYLPVEAVWPDDVRATLFPGRYRMILTAPGGDAYSSLRYEFPAPVTLGGAAEIPVQRPVFHTLKARFTDRKGNPLIGAPVMLHGTGDTSVVTDSGRGEISVRVPADTYTVRVLVFDDKGSREVTLDRKLDLSTDQERSWKAPVNTIDFGFTSPAVTRE
jgi:hypothetical protein